MGDLSRLEDRWAVAISMWGVLGRGGGGKLGLGALGTEPYKHAGVVVGWVGVGWRGGAGG